MLSNVQIVQAIVNAYAVDGFVVSDKTVIKTNEEIDKFMDGKATISNQFKDCKGGDMYV